MVVLQAGRAFAAEATPTATPATGKTKQIEDLKERLATKVAELADIQRKAVFGTVTSVSLTTIVLGTETKDVKVEVTDEMKVIQVLKGKRTTLTPENIEKGDVVTVFGSYDTTLELLKANVVFLQEAFGEHVAGTVTDINRTAFTLTVTTPEGKAFVVDIEKSTKTTLWDTAQGVTKGGFTKVNVGDSVHVVGTPVPKKENRVSASRILDIGNVTGASTAKPTP